jgi:hypothetical protein
MLSYSLAVDNILKAIDKFLTLSRSNPAYALDRRVNFAISRSFSYDLGCVDRYSRLEIFN